LKDKRENLIKNFLLNSTDVKEIHSSNLQESGST
jgi:hypothetical protein